MSQTTYCRCIKIIRTDGIIMGFTSSDRDLTIDGLTYKASAATDAVAIKRDVKLDTDNVTIRSILDNDAVTAKDIVNGRYRNAKIVMAKIDYLNPPATLLEGEILLSGKVGNIELTDGIYVMEIRGLTAVLNQGVSVKASPICRWRFGDENCGINLAPLSFYGTVSGVVNNQELTTNLNPTRTLTYGYIEFTSGVNQGLIYNVKSNTGGLIQLLSSLQYPPAVGDALKAVAGCKKDQWTCRDTWGNFRNFGGEPQKWSENSGYFPGTDKLINPDRD
jgi:uncharacterized phage protein (TIGR02218 family)